MNYRKKLLSVPGSLLVLCSVSACNLAGMNDYFAPDRRVPEGASVDFGNRHSPLLNPSETRSGTRHAPTENMDSSSIKNIPTIQKSPVVPVTTASIAPVPSGNVAASTKASSESSYPALASVPSKPVVPPQDKIKSDFSTLIAQQQATDTERKSFISDPNATVMTSPQSGQLVDNPASAMPLSSSVATAGQAVPSNGVPVSQQPQAKEDKAAAANSTGKSPGSNASPHNMVSSDKKSPGDNLKNFATRRTPVENDAMNQAVSSAELANPVSAIPVAGSSGVVSSVPQSSVPVASKNGAPVLREPPVHDEISASVPDVSNMSPQSAPLAQPGNPVSSGNVVPVINEALDKTVSSAPVVESQQKTASNTGRESFGSWLSNLFSGKKQTVETQADGGAGNKTEVFDVTNRNLSSGNIAGTATNTPPAVAAAPTSAIETTALPAPSKAHAPVDLSPSAASAGDAKSLPDISQLSTPDDRPVNLVQPSAYSGNGYMEDSRYAERVHSPYGSN